MSERVEGRIRKAHEAGDMAAAAEAALDGYGRELFGFLIATTRSESDASEIFAQLGEDLWRGLPGLQWRASARTWLYKLARNAACKYRRDPWQKGGRRLAASRMSEAIARVRTETLKHLRTEMKQEVAKLREQLDAEEQELLVLRIDRRLSWDEIATILSDVSNPEELDRAAARSRKRFQLVKDKLKRLAKEAGLLQRSS